MPKAACNLYKTDIPLILPIVYIDTKRQLGSWEENLYFTYVCLAVCWDHWRVKKWIITSRLLSEKLQTSNVQETILNTLYEWQNCWRTEILRFISLTTSSSWSTGTLHQFPRQPWNIIPPLSHVSTGRQTKSF